MCLISSLFMQFYNLGKTKNLEAALGHNKEGKKQQCLLPNRVCAATLKNTPASRESAHKLPGAPGEVKT